MAERVLTTGHVNRAVLARQRFLERDSLPIPRLLEAIGGIQDQYAPAGYIGLWTRLREFPRGSLTEALERREVVQATLMRSTIHLVSTEDYRLMAAGTRRLRRQWWERTQGRALDSIGMDRAAALARSLLADGPKRQKELQAAFAEEGFERIAWASVGNWVDLVRVPPSGTWDRRRADLYGLADDWVGGMDGASEEDGLELLLRRYLEGFGPAPLADAATWAGVPVAALKPAVERLDLRRFRDEAGRELLDLPDLPIPDPDTPAPVRLLPVWDASLLVHARRTGILPEEHRSKVFNTKTPHSVDTFLVDGRVAGTWRHEDGSITLAPFGKLPRRVADELRDEADRLEAFLA
ncbi:MAG TPA: winged helix DNA-binding domain-containing protein [Candidatus Limnocylindrales bacterium]|nr:winged helix DNA-binding domain-containing protein [Candidatus Limnocylindrales bacterium]